MEKILVIRNDKLGDYMLSWPAISLLKRQSPRSHLTVLIPAYTSGIAELCPWIDSILMDDGNSARDLAGQITSGRFNASISLYSELRTALALWLARIPVRIGPATKIAQTFLNYRLRQKRSQSLKPEYEYNLDLARFYITQRGDTPVKPTGPPYLEFNAIESQTLRERYIIDHEIADGKKLIFIHPGGGGSAVNLTLKQFAQLADRLAQAANAHFVITAGPDELETAIELSSLIHDHPCSIYHSLQGLQQFARFISTCDLFISGSTGPLHIAGALNVPTAAFYPARRSATALRWQTLNDAGKRIAFSPKKYQKTATTLDVDIDICAAKIASFLETHAQSRSPRNQASVR